MASTHFALSRGGIRRSVGYYCDPALCFHYSLSVRRKSSSPLSLSSPRIRRNIATAILPLQRSGLSSSFFSPPSSPLLLPAFSTVAPLARRSSHVVAAEAVPPCRGGAPSSTTTSASSSFASSASSATATASTTIGGDGGRGGEAAAGIAGKIFFSSLCILTFGLGTWQTVRYFEKVEMVKKRDDDLALDPLSSYDEWLMLTCKTNENAATTPTTNNTASANERRQGDGGGGGGDGGAAAEAKSYRRVHLRGQFKHDEQILVGPRGPPPGALAESGPNSGRGGGGGMSSSAQGYWVVTPFVVSRNDDGDDDDEERDRGTKEIVGGDVPEEEATSKRRSWFGGLFRGRSSGRPSSILENHDDVEAGSVQRMTNETASEETVVWINRGWIPRHFVGRNNEILAEWEQPRGTVRLTAMESKTEKPGTFAPPSRLDSKKRPANSIDANDGDDNGGEDGEEKTLGKLLWMDREAMRELMPCGSGADAGDDDPPLFVEIYTNDDDGGKLRSYPAKPPREFVGEFKVTPPVHVGYAATWFGLSGAGILMTRKLLTRGR